MRFVVIAILIYFAYIFIFRFVIPVYKASRKFKKGFSEIHARMQEQMKQQQQGHDPQPSRSEQKPPPKKDYIEFEEL